MNQCDAIFPASEKYDPTTDSPKANPKVWKANFRCAINSLPDIEELREKGKTKGNDAYKVYRLHPKKTKRQSRDAEGSKVIKRQRSTSKSRGNRPDKKQRKRNGLVIPSPENLNKLSDHSSITKLSNASDDLAEDLLKKRMAELSAAYSMTESAKTDRMRLNVHCVFKPNGNSSTVSSGSLLSPMSPPSTLQSPTTPYSSTMSTDGLHFVSPNAYTTSSMAHSTCVSPCSTVTSTPASTPQSPPPSYHVVMNNRQGMGFNMEARFELSHQHHMGYDSYHEDLSDSDSSSGRMSEKEVADLVFELKDQSPGNSPRSISPLDGNNNVDPAVDYSTYWTNHPRHPVDDSRTFLGNGCDIMTAQNSRVMPDLPGYEPSPIMTHIKVEPETHLPMAPPQHHNAMLNGYTSTTASLGLNTQHHDAYADSNYLLHQL